MKYSKTILKTCLASAIGASTLFATSMVSAGQFDGVTLRVGTWGGSWKENQVNVIVPKFEAEGGKIEFVTGSPQANLAKLIAGRGKAPFDIMEILDAQIQDFKDAEFLQPLDLDKIPNKQHLEDWQVSDMVVGSWFTQEVICYNKDKYAELGLEPPKTYTDLANPKLAGRLSIPDITSGGGLANFGAFAHAAGGDEANIQPGLDLIKSMNALKFWSRGGEVVTQFESGDVYAAVVHAGWCTRAKNAGSNVTSVHPFINDQHTGVHKHGWLGIMKSSENAAAANWFINAYLDEAFQFEFAQKSGVVPVNKNAIAKLSTDPVLDEMLQTSSEEISQQLRIDYSKADVADWTDQWNRSVAQ
jgi:putative spermidine/putrescine transport system substrate-binding protein